jgi:DNA-binding NarL/FixJ family response regulator
VEEPVDVLVVEDHELVRDAVAIALDLAGLRVAVATDLATDAVTALAQASQPRVVLLDYFLDDNVDSLPLIAPLAGVGSAVLVLTGAADPAIWGACLLAGAAGVIDKSGALDDLIDRVKAVIAGDPAMEEGDRERLLAEARLAGARESRRLHPFDRLSPTEAAVLRQLLAGRGPEDIARDEYVSLTTVRNHVGSILEKLGVQSVLAAISLAREAGWA